MTQKIPTVPIHSCSICVAPLQKVFVNTDTSQFLDFDLLCLASEIQLRHIFTVTLENDLVTANMFILAKKSAGNNTEVNKSASGSDQRHTGNSGKITG